MKFNDLIQNLQNLATSTDGVSGMASVTAIGSMLKNIKTTSSPTNNDKIYDRISKIDGIIR